MRVKHVVTLVFRAVTLREFCSAYEDEGSVHESVFVCSEMLMYWQKHFQIVMKAFVHFRWQSLE